MSFNEIKSGSYCVGGRHRSSTKLNYSDITSECIKVLVGYCSICNRKKTMTISDNTIQAEGLGSFFESLRKISAKTSKNLAINALKILARFLESVLKLLPQLQV